MAYIRHIIPSCKREYQGKFEDIQGITHYQNGDWWAVGIEDYKYGVYHFSSTLTNNEQNNGFTSEVYGDKFIQYDKNCGIFRMASKNYLEPISTSRGYKTDEGQFVNGLLIGIGMFHHNSSDDSDENYKFLGHFIDSVAEGKGTINYDNENRFEGNFQNGLAHGKCKFFIHKGLMTHFTDKCDTFDCEYSNGYANGDGIYQSIGTYHCVKPYRFECKFVNGSANGIGTMYQQNGNRNVSNYVNDFPIGPSITYYPNGNQLEGDYKDGKKFGRWLLFDSKREIIKSFEYNINGKIDV